MNIDRPRPADAANEAFFTLISAALFLYVGFGLGLKPTNPEAAVNYAVIALIWGARLIGVALLLFALAPALRISIPPVLDVVVSFAAAALCLAVAAIFIAYEYRQGYMLGLFGLINTFGARQTWLRWRAIARSRAADPPERPT